MKKEIELLESIIEELKQRNLYSEDLSFYLYQLNELKKEQDNEKAR